MSLSQRHHDMASRMCDALKCYTAQDGDGMDACLNSLAGGGISQAPPMRRGQAMASRNVNGFGEVDPSDAQAVQDRMVAMANAPWGDDRKPLP